MLCESDAAERVRVHLVYSRHLRVSVCPSRRPRPRRPVLRAPSSFVSSLRPARRAALLLVAALALASAARAQEPVRGVVWDVPERMETAVADLRGMARAGVQAVRTGLVEDERLLRLADTLGLQLYQELPVGRLSASTLVDSAEGAARLLRGALQRARRHPSARHFGLARRSDTHDAAACVYFEALSEIAREALPSARTYYVSVFPEDDRCAGAVDLVLLDALDAEAPAAVLDGWAGETPVGLATLGTWVRSDTLAGLRRTRSPEAQARYLEDHLGPLVARAAAPPAVVFVYRWRDQYRQQRMDDDLDVFQRRYGLMTLGRTPRPAMDVVAGLYTGEQTVFAFPAGRASDPPWPWMMLLGWTVVLAIGILYAATPRFRHMVPRYFAAHVFYREALRGRRDVMPEASAVLLITFALSVGLAGAYVVQTLQHAPALQTLLAWQAPAWRAVLVTLMEQPWMLALLLGSVYALLLALWASMFGLASRRRYALMPGQAFMLVIWPHWPLLLLMIAAVVGTTLPAATAVWVAWGVAAGLVATSLLALVRALVDLMSVSHIGPGWVLLLALVSPPVLLLVLVGVVVLTHPAEASFLWHLAWPR